MDTFTGKTNILKGKYSSGNEWSPAFWHFRVAFNFAIESVLNNLSWDVLASETSTKSKLMRRPGGGGQQANFYLEGFKAK